MTKFDCSAIKGAPHLYRISGKAEASRCGELKTVLAAAEPGPREVPAIAVRERLTDQTTLRVDIVDRRLGRLTFWAQPLMVDGLTSHITAQRTAPVQISTDETSAQRNALPRRFDLIAVFKPRRAVLLWSTYRIRMHCPVFLSIVEQTAGIVVDEALRQRSFGDDHVMRWEFEMEVSNRFNAFRLDDRQAVDEILCLNQHAVEINGVMRRNPKIASRHISSSAPALMQIGRTSVSGCPMMKRPP